jgi:hypothetical protein
MTSIDVDEKQLVSIRSLLNSTDELCTAVISGKPGQMQLALRVAGVLSDLKRQGFLKGVK